jgi:acyl-homoserine lactone acylase PvdQ
MRKFIRIAVICAAALWTLHSAVAPAGISDSLKTHEVLIHRDTWGTPHIYGKSATAVAFGFGYAQAEDHLDGMLKLFLGAKGELARVEGEKALREDVQIRTLLPPDILDQLWEKTPQPSRDYYQAFADGINRYLGTHSKENQPWHWKLTGRDIAAYTKYSILRNALWVAAAKTGHDPGNDGRGSNAWAIAPSRSASGKAMLLGNPHLPLTGPLQWYEAHLKCPEFDMAGASFFGVPIPAIGTNGKIAWSITDNKADIADVYAEKIDPRDPDRYLDSDGQWKTMEKRSFQIQVIQAGGGLKTVPYVARYTRRGPYMAAPGGGKRSFTLALAGWKDMPDILTGAIQRAAARNLNEIKASLSEYPMDKGHLVYADRDGNIYAVGNGYFPRRDPKYDWTKPVPGWEEGAQWKGILPFPEVPQFANPTGGLIVQCNQSIFVSADPSPIKEADYPPHIAQGSTLNRPGSRHYRVFDLLKAPKITFDENRRTAVDVAAIGSSPYVKLMLEALEEQQDAGDADLQTMHSILKSWDGLATLDNQAMAILLHFNRIAKARRLPLNPDGFNSPQARKAAFEVLRETAVEMRKLYGKVGVPMRAVLFLKRGSKELPVAGSGGTNTYNPYGAIFPNQAKEYRNGKFYVTNGASYMILVSFETPLKVYTLLPFGDSENPSSPHFSDQLDLYSKRELKPLAFTDDEVRKVSEKSYKLELK